MSEVPLYSGLCGLLCEDQVLDGPASGKKGSKGRPLAAPAGASGRQDPGLAVRVSGFGIRV